MVSRRTARVWFFAFLLLIALGVTWPGALLFDDPTPLVLGLPLNMMWPAFLIVASGVALWLLDRVEERESDDPGSEGPPDRTREG